MLLSVQFDQFNLKDVTLLSSIFDSIKDTLSCGNPLRDEIVLVLHKDECPMCSRLGKKICAISLHCPEDLSGLQYAYQFAHEFCHWMIGGSLSGERKGLFWLEETICELASFHCLSVLRFQWSSFAPHYPLEYVDIYIRDMLKVGSPAAPLPLQGYIDAHQEELYTPFYHRDLYAQMALALYPHFLMMPNLWRLLPYLGNMQQYLLLSDWLADVAMRTPENLHFLVRMIQDLFLEHH